MPRRQVYFRVGEYYHIFNHSVGEMPIFKGARECTFFLEAMRFYLQLKPQTKFSIFRNSPNSFPYTLENKVVSIIDYCLMPNHFHLTLRQETEDGIVHFIQKLSSSFAHYYSIKYKKRGHVFEDKFKSVHLENTEQLLHLSRYIHLNPVTAYIVQRPEDYPYSSYNAFIGLSEVDFIDTLPILENFPSVQKYKEFVTDQIDYQKVLDRIKHLIFE